jgi:hypothetical protein
MGRIGLDRAHQVMIAHVRIMPGIIFENRFVPVILPKTGL